MKNLVSKKQGKVVIRPSPEDAADKVRGLAAKLTTNNAATLTDRERDLLLIAIAQRLGIAA